MKRILIIVLSLLTLLSIGSVNNVFAEQDWQYNTDTKTLEFTGSGDIEGYRNYPNHYLERPWNEYADLAEAIVIGENYTSIGTMDFYEFTKVTSVEIKSPNISIGESAFAYMPLLENIIFKEGSTVNIGNYAFNGSGNNNAMKTLNLRGNITIGHRAFQGINSLETITLSGEGIKVEDYAFDGISRLNKLVINDVLLENIEPHVFIGICPVSLAELMFNAVDWDNMSQPYQFDYSQIKDQTLRSKVEEFFSNKTNDDVGRIFYFGGYELENTLNTTYIKSTATPISYPSSWNLTEENGYLKLGGGLFLPIKPDADINDDVGIPDGSDDDTRIIDITDRIDNDLSGVLKEGLDLKDFITLTTKESQSGVWTWMELLVADEGTVSTVDKEKIDSVLGNKKLGAYIDISIYKQIPGEDKEKVSTLLDDIVISIVVPSELKNIGKDFAIAYVHDGEANVITPISYNETTGILLFEASKFSTYSLIYSPKGNENPPTNPTPSGTPSEEQEPSSTTPYRAPNTSVK